MTIRSYRYVGPADLAAHADAATMGHAIRTAPDFAAWAARRTTAELAEPFTFVVDLTGLLRLAPRRTEHVACAGGARVLAAGEIAFAHDAASPCGWRVTEVTNHSTGYCPEPTCWPAVSRSLHRAALPHPASFTHALTFRRCAHCHQPNIVREDDWYCAFCDTELPRHWNVDPSA
ncbi:hypothetical protein [Streptomyces sp. 3N207]|uniref:hypothetical protein n=1 Tax=Streptomyces sp. 3N207 TaxID=3457417 RepID=UPI003FD576E8